MRSKIPHDALVVTDYTEKTMHSLSNKAFWNVIDLLDTTRGQTGLFGCAGLIGERRLVRFLLQSRIVQADGGKKKKDEFMSKYPTIFVSRYI